MMQLSEVYSDCMNLNSNVKRMDSLMIASRCRCMSRLEIIYSTTANAVRLMHRLGNEELIPKELIHYLDPDDYNNVIYTVKVRTQSPVWKKHFWKLHRSKSS